MTTQAGFAGSLARVNVWDRLRFHLTPYLLLSPAFILTLVFFIVPISIVIVFSFWTRVAAGSMEAIYTLDNYARLLTTPVYVEMLYRTLRLSVLTTVASLVMSYPLAYWLARSKLRWRNLALLGLVISFWSSIIVRAFAWMVLLGGTGIVNRSFGLFGIGPLPLMYNEVGTVIGLVHVMIPFMVFPIYASLAAIDPSVEQAAEGLGANKLRRFLRVTLPLSLPGTASGCLLVFITTSGFFITPALLGGGRVLVIAWVVVQQAGILNYPFAAVLSVFLLAVVMALVAVFNRMVGIERIGGGLYVA